MSNLDIFNTKIKNELSSDIPILPIKNFIDNNILREIKNHFDECNKIALYGPPGIGKTKRKTGKYRTFYRKNKTINTLNR